MAKTNENSPIIPAPGYCVVTPYIEENLGGFARTDEQKEKESQNKGLVLAVSNGAYVSEYGATILAPKFLKEGAIVVVKKWGPEDITINSKKYRVMKYPDIVGVLEK